MKKRIFSILLAVVMLLGMIPGTALTAFAAETPTITVTGLTAPQAGQILEVWAMANVPSLTLSCGEFNEIHLFEGKVTNLVEASEAFEANYPEYTFAEGDYTFMFVADPVEGEPTVVCPGASATSYYTDGEFGYVFVTCAVSAATITVGGFPAPQAEQSVEEWWNSIPAPVTLSGGVTWMGEENMLWIEGEYDNVEDAVAALTANGPFEGTFEKGKKYTFYAAVVPGGGELPAAATVVASGASNTAYEKPGEDEVAALFLTYTVGDAASDTLTITGISAPQEGRYAYKWGTNLGSIPALDLSVSGVYEGTITKIDDIPYDTYQEKFVAGNVYTLVAFVPVLTEYTFPANPEVYATGATSVAYDAEYLGEYEGVHYYNRAIFLTYTAVAAPADITIWNATPPADGQTLTEWNQELTSLNGLEYNVSISECQRLWYEGEYGNLGNNAFSGTFVKGEKYTLVIGAKSDAYTLPATTATVYAEGASATAYEYVGDSVFDAKIYLTFICGQEETYTVNFEGDKCTLEGNATVENGQDYTATIQVNGGYRLPATITVKAGSTPLTAGTDYSYNRNTGALTINASAITDDITIVVDGVKRIYNITFTGAGYNKPINDTIVEGVDVDFYTLVASEGYVLPDTITIKAGGTTLTAGTDYTYDKDTGKFTVYAAAITGDLTIEVNAVGVYVVTLTEGTGYEIKPYGASSSPVLHGNSYSFTVEIKSGYKAGSGFAVKVNDTPIAANDGVYTIENITEAKTITVVGVSELDTYTVNKSAPDGFTVTGADTATENSNYTAMLAANDNYKLPDSISIWVGSSTITAGTDYTYDKNTGAVTIFGAAVKGNIVFSGQAVRVSYNVTFAGSNHNYVGATEKAIIGEDYTITFTPASGYRIYSATVKINGSIVNSCIFDDASDTLTIPAAEIVDDIRITVYSEEIPTSYGVTFEGSNFTKTGSDRAAIGENYVATITPATGYEITQVRVTVSGNNLLEGITYEGTTLTIDKTKITGAIVVYVSTAEIPTSYGVTFDGSNFEETGSDRATIGENYVATITPATGYEITQVRVTVKSVNLLEGVTFDGTTLTIDKNKITGDMVVHVSTQKIPNKYTVEWNDDGQNYSITATPDSTSPVTITEGGSFSFVVTLGGDYKEGDNFKVLANGNVVTKSGAFYVIENINENITITVEGVVAKSTYTITLPNGSGVSSAPAATYTTSVIEGNSFRFTVSIADDYKATGAFAVKASGGHTVTKDGDVYVINNVTGDITVTVEGVVAKPTYTITLPNGSGVSSAPATTYTTSVIEGNSFRFTVSIADDYKATGAFAVKASGGHTVTKDGDVYVINNVTGDITVTVEGVVAKPTYTVTLPTGTGFTSAVAAGYSTTVVEGKNFSFVVSIVDGYRANANFKVKANGVELTKDGTGYTVTNITANTVITVEGVEALPEYTITLPTGTGFTSTVAAGYTTTVVEGKDFHFVVSVTGNYREGANFKVKANGVELTKTSGYYAITNVTANQVITVEGVEELPKYTVTLPTGTGFTSAPAAGNSSPVYEGGSFSFVVSIVDGYRANANFKVKANGVELTKDGTGYTITNITANQVITVEGVEKIPTPPVHTHNYGTTWKTDGTNHWHECSCGAKKDSAAHTGGTATCTAKAKCSVCEAEYGELAAHTYVDGKCACGATDPNYQPPHEHNFVEGKCECGETDPNYTPDDNDGLGTGAIVAIVVGSVTVAGVGGFALVWFVIKKKTWAEFLVIFKKG